MSDGRKHRSVCPLNLEPAMSFTEIGLEIGLDKRTVRQIYNKAIEKIKANNPEFLESFKDYFVEKGIKEEDPFIEFEEVVDSYFKDSFNNEIEEEKD